MAKAVGVGGIFLKARDPKALEAAGVRIDPHRDDFDFGRFAWIWDLEGNKVELWQPL